MQNYIETTRYCPAAKKIVTGYVNEFYDCDASVVQQMKPIGTMVQVSSQKWLPVGGEFRGNKIFWGVFGCENGWTYKSGAEYDENGKVIGIKAGTRIFTSMAH